MTQRSHHTPAVGRHSDPSADADRPKARSRPRRDYHSNGDDARSVRTNRGSRQRRQPAPRQPPVPCQLRSTPGGRGLRRSAGPPADSVARRSRATPATRPIGTGRSDRVRRDRNRAAPGPLIQHDRATATARPAQPSPMFHVKHPGHPAGSSRRPARRSSRSASSCSPR